MYQISEGVRFYSWNRVEGIYHNKRGGDCAPCTAKFMEMHCNGDEKEEMSLITNRVVDKIREQYAMDCYEEFVGDYRVANEAIWSRSIDSTYLLSKTFPGCIIIEGVYLLFVWT